MGITNNVDLKGYCQIIQLFMYNSSIRREEKQSTKSIVVFIFGSTVSSISCIKLFSSIAFFFHQEIISLLHTYISGLPFIWKRLRLLESFFSF